MQSLFDSLTAAAYHSALMSTQLPDLANPWRLVQQHKAFSGQLGPKDFLRLCAATLGVLSDIQYRLAFTQDEQGRALVSGWVGLEAQLECRRCLGGFPFVLDAPFDLVLVETEAQADALEDEVDTLVLADAPARLVEILEDEALLALPPFPRHASGDCSAGVQASLIRLAPQVAKGPFAVLESIKKH